MRLSIQVSSDKVSTVHRSTSISDVAVKMTAFLRTLAGGSSGTVRDARVLNLTVLIKDPLILVIYIWNQEFQNGTLRVFTLRGLEISVVADKETVSSKCDVLVFLRSFAESWVDFQVRCFESNHWMP